MDLILDGFQLGEEMAQRHAVLQGYRTGRLNDGAVGQGVAEGNAHLYEVDAVALHGLDDVARALERWATGAEIQAEQLAVATA